MIYLDHSATSLPKAKDVGDAMAKALQLANPGRSGYGASIEASRVIYDARFGLAELLSLNDETRLIWTSGATESLNLAIRGLLRPGARVISSNLEHNSVARPLEYGRQNLNWRWDILDVTRNDFLAQFAKAVEEQVDLVVLNHLSNVTGQRLPMKEVRQICQTKKIPILWDVSQSVGCEQIRVEDHEVIAGSGHKGLRGPMGIGFLAVGNGLEIEPLKFGGTGSASESLSLPNFWPDRYESGTPNVPGIAGLGQAILGLSPSELDLRQSELQARRTHLWENLNEIKKLNVIGPREGGSALSVTAEGDLGLLAQVLWEEHQIALRVGLHCSPMAHQSLGTFPMGTLRVAPAYDTSYDDLNEFISAIQAALNRF